MGKGLDEILSGDESEVTEPVAETPQEPEANTEAEPEKAEQPRGPDGKFAPKTGVEPQPEPQAPQAEAVPPTAGLPKDVYEPLRAVRDENRQLKEQIEALNKQFQSLQQPKEPPAPPPSLWDDEQGWQTHLQQQIIAQADQLSRINASEMAARAQHPDFQEMFDLFNNMAAENPSVVQQAMADPHPWGKAYQIARNYKQVQELGATNLDELKAKLREELLAEAQAQTPAPKPQAPPTLTNERSVGQRSGPAWSGPKSLDELLS